MMPKKSRDVISANDQHRRFVETARELGCDEDEAAFDEKLKRIATAKPEPSRKKSKPRMRQSPRS
jgi:hypothetical protein